MGEVARTSLFRREGKGIVTYSRGYVFVPPVSEGLARRAAQEGIVQLEAHSDQVVRGPEGQQERLGTFVVLSHSGYEHDDTRREKVLPESDKRFKRVAAGLALLSDMTSNLPASLDEATPALGLGDPIEYQPASPSSEATTH